MVVLLAAVPRAPALEICKIPFPIVVAPVKVVELSELNNKVPVPFFVIDTEPSVPENVLDVTSVLADKRVNTFDVEVLVMVPDPEIVEIVSLLSLRSKIAGEVTTKLAPSLKLVFDNNLSLPAFTLICGVVALVVL